MEKTVKTLGIVCLLVMAGFIGFIIFEPKVVSAQTTRYVGGTGGGNYSSIQDAINESSDGDTVFVYNRTYFENIVVNRTINLTGENKDITIIDGGGSGDVVSITSNWVNITGFNITNGDRGINAMPGTSNITINNNIVHSNIDHGINLDSSQNNSITNNDVHSNIGIGIYTRWPSSNNNAIMGNNISSNGWGIQIKSPYNNITNNYIANNNFGIYLFTSSNNNITNNSFVNDGVFIWGTQLSHFNTHTIPDNNMVNGKKLYYYKDTSGMNIDGIPVGQLILANCTNFDMRNLQIDNTDVGIEVAYSTNTLITSNDVSMNYYYGIYLRYSSNNNTITGNNITENGYGIRLDLSSDNNITNNNVSLNTNFGIFVYSSNYGTISGNNISSNEGTGIQLTSSSNNSVSGNNITNNNLFGIYIFASSNDNNVTNNNVSDNGNGTYIHFSSNNNNIINNIFLSNSDNGIYLVLSSNIKIIGNDVLNNDDLAGYIGINVRQSSTNNTIADNNVSSNSWGGAVNIYQSSDNDILNNNITNKKGDCIEISGSDNCEIMDNYVLSDNETGIYLSLSDNCFIINNTGDDIWLWQSSYNDVIGNNVSNGREGIRLDNSSYNDIMGNEISGSAFYGIYIYDSSTNNMITNNDVYSNLDIGIYIRLSSNNDVINNNVLNNVVGIRLEQSSYNNITYNDIISNTNQGLHLPFMSSSNFFSNNLISNNSVGIDFDNGCTDNTISNNTIFENNIGVVMNDSPNNYIHHNNFIDNTNQVITDIGINQWDIGYPSGGNYWSDWYFPDMNCDGFVDEPRLVPVGPNQDNWPFTEMNGWLTSWTNKTGYPNYAPSAMPDFDQRQKGGTFWMTINAGPDGILDPGTIIIGDDVLVNSTPGQNNISIAPGFNHQIDTAPMGDDTLEYSYCGPVAAANALWWLDSEFGDPFGIPGDGIDNYSLISDMGVGDDHAINNVPLVIEDLAVRFNTINEGDTNVSRMISGLNQLLTFRNQASNHSVSNLQWPMFEEVAQEFEKCYVAILFLGFYDSEGNRTYGHIVTVSGVNMGTFEIGISDPIINNANPIADFAAYTNPINVSHDVYMVMPGPPPVSNPPPSQFWLLGYTSGYSIPIPIPYYAVVEDVVFISSNSIPDAPTGLAAVAGATYVNISWNAPGFDGGSPIIKYRIYRGTTPGGETFYTEIGNLTYFNDTTVTGGVTYYYKVSAVNSVGEGPLSNETNGTPIGPPTKIDFIKITNAPNGTELTIVTLNVGENITIYASGYNSTGSTYLGLVEVNWTQLPSLGLFSSTKANSTTFTAGMLGGTINITGSNNTLGVSDNFTLIINPPEVDYINITDIPNGTELTGGTVIAGFKEWGNCSAYNNTAGYIGTVPANWSVEGELSASLLGPTPAVLNGIDVGIAGGTVWLNATYNGKTDSIQYSVIPPTIDYIVILNTSSIEIVDQIVPFGFTIEGKVGQFNNSIGYFGDISVNWSVVNASGANASTSPLSGMSSIFNAGITTGTTTWIADDGDGHNDTVVFTIEPPTIDYLDITDTPGGIPLTGGAVDLNFQEWGNCSLYNNTIDYLYTVAANWTVEGGNASLLGLSTPSEFNGINVGNLTTIVWFNASYFDGTNWFNDTVIYIPTPTVDYIEITDVPDGTPLVGGIVPVGLQQWGNCSLYNNTIGFIGTVIANWTNVGGSSSLLGPTPSDANGIDVGTLVDSIWFNVSYDGHTDSVKYIISKPYEPQFVQISAGDSWINITWTVPVTEGSSPITNYTIYKGNTSGGEIFLTRIGNVTYFNDTNVTNGEIYYYMVSANNSLGEGPLSDEVNIKAGSVPSPPIGLEAEAGVAYVYLTWNTPARDGGLPITNYIVYKGLTSGGETFLVEIGLFLFYNDTTVTNGTTYYYTVSAVNSYGVGPMSNEDNATPAGPPTAPPGLTAIAGDSYVNLTWDIPFSNGSSPITGYNIYRNDTTGVYATVPPGQLWYNDTNVINNITYAYNVTAVNNIGESPLSNEAIATPAEPIIPVNEPPECTISAPANGTTVSGLIAVSGTASDIDSEVQSVWIRIDDEDWIEASGKFDWSYTIDTRNLSNGEHTISARAFDGESNSSVVSISVNVDNPSPAKEKSVFEEAWFWILIVLIIIVLLFAFLWFTKTRRELKKEEEEEEFEEEEEEEEELEEEEEEEPEEELEEEEGELEEEEEEEVPEEEMEEEEVEELPKEEKEEKAKEELEEEEVEWEELGEEEGLKDEEPKGEVEKEPKGVMGKEAKKREVEKEAEGGEFECPECGATIGSTATTCPKCGVEFEE